MNTQEKKYNQTNCVALTVKKENGLLKIDNVQNTFVRISLKTILYTVFLTVLNLVV